MLFPSLSTSPCTVKGSSHSSTQFPSSSFPRSTVNAIVAGMTRWMTVCNSDLYIFSPWIITRFLRHITRFPLLLHSGLLSSAQSKVFTFSSPGCPKSFVDIVNVLGLREDACMCASKALYLIDLFMFNTFFPPNTWVYKHVSLRSGSYGMGIRHRLLQYYKITPILQGSHTWLVLENTSKMTNVHENTSLPIASSILVDYRLYFVMFWATFYYPLCLYDD